MTKEKNVLLISHFSNLSGAPISLVLLASHLEKHGYRPLVTLPAKGPLEEVLRKLSVRYVIIGTVSLPIRLPLLILKKNIAIVHANTVLAAPAALLAWLMRRKLIWHIREDISGNHILKRLIGRISDRVIILSRSMMADFSGRRVRGRVRIVHNGVDFTLFAPLPEEEREKIREELGITPDRKNVAVIGTVEKRKGQKYLIEAAKLLRHRGDVRYFIIGNPLPGYKRLYHKLRAECQKHDLPVTFVPARADIPGLLQLIDIVCVPSLGEPFGRVVIEGMAAGKPVVGSRVGGIPEIILDGVTGFLVPPGDSRALAEKVSLLLDDADMAGRMGNEGRERARNSFSIEKHVEQIAAVYEEICHEL